MIADEWYYIEKAQSWMKRTGITEKRYAIEMVKGIIGIGGKFDVTIECGGRSITIDREKVQHAKDILKGLRLMKVNHANKIRDRGNNGDLPHAMPEEI